MPRSKSDPVVPAGLAPPKPGTCGATILKKHQLDEPNAEGHTWEYAIAGTGARIVERWCGYKPMKGGTRCGRHGGKAPQVKAKAAERIETEKVRAAVGKLGIVADDELQSVDPVAELQKALARARHRVLALEQVVSELGEDRLIQATPLGEKASAWVEMLNEERDRYNSLLTVALKLNLREREVAVQEAQVAGLIGILQYVLTALDQQVAPLRLAELVEEGRRSIEA